ncbi:MAG: isoprenylcysteine carboxylmethyltransferase family protein [Acidobacteria bacterium]|nr:isoprenylcysteine carboxylmethyltransferase family protein [Acidobacteriota bacterium]
MAGRSARRDLAARAAVAVLLTLFSVNLLQHFLQTGRLTSLLLLVSEGLVVPLTVFRRRALAVDRSTVSRATTALSIAGPPLMRAAEGPGLAPDAVTLWLTAGGLALVIAGKLALGRSFGLIPANRGVVAGGPYRIVRHPIYTGYLVTHVAFLLAHPRPWNAAIAALADLALVRRALLEERILARDTSYERYSRRVEWHLVPGVF